MNLLQLIRLFRTIYFGSPPDIQLIQHLGLLAVKIGQTYAQRADFLSEASCRELAKLYRKTNASHSNDFDALLKASIGSNWLDQFQSLSPTPLACASVGQVHRAILRDGNEVVVKLVRGEFRDSFQRDVDRVDRLLRILVLFYPKLARVADPVGTLHSIGDSTLAELDLRNEANGQDELSQIYLRYRDEFDLAKLQFPRIYRELSGERVLVSEYISEPTFDELLESGQLPLQALMDLFEIHGFFLFCIGTFHGDIHPGNLILRDGRIVFLDTGSISRVPDMMRRGLFRFFDALVAGDFDRSASSLEAMSRSTIAASRAEQFRGEFRQLYQGFLGKTVAELSLSRQMMQTIRLAVDHGMNFETGMYPIIKSLMYLDGMVLRCSPETDLMSDLKPFLDRFRPWVERSNDASA